MDKHEKDYKWLLDYQQRSGEFWVSDCGCGMVRYRSKGWNNKGLILADPAQEKAYLLVMPDGEISGFTADDFDWESIERSGYAYLARKLKVNYRFDVGRFRDGVAEVYWMVNPDGSYYADEDGFGRTNDKEVNLYALIDTQCRVVRKFRYEKE